MNHKKIFDEASPWPHLIIDNYIDDKLLTKILDDFPNLTSKKSKLNDYDVRSTTLNIKQQSKPIQDLYEILYGEEVCSLMDKLSEYKIVRGLEKCLCENGDLRGAGIHQTGHGGFMKVHRDPNWHHEKKWLRPLSGLLFLNKNWKPENGGYLELWDRNCKEVIKKIEPIYNRFVITSNDETTYHSVSLVSNFIRKSICSFYYTEEKLGKPHKFLFVDSSDVLLSIEEIKNLPEIKQKESICFYQNLFKQKYKDFDLMEFEKLCKSNLMN